MKIRLKQILASTLLACMMAVMIPFQLMTAFAADARISFSDPSVMVGKEVSVTMKVNSVGGEALGGADVTLSYDPNVLEFVSGTNASGGAGSVRVIGSMDSANTTSFKFTLKFKALQAGKTSITVARQEVNDVNTQPVTVSKVGNSAVNVTPLATYSNDAALKSLKIDPGTLTPEFSSKVTEYTATVGGDVSKLVVSAGTSNANAKVVISGTELKEGENTVVCKVTAEDGETVKKYTIKVTKTAETTAEEPSEGGKTELGDIKATVDGTEYFVATSFDSSLLPAGFQAGKTAYQGGEVASATGNGMTLFYLADANGNGGFYVYDEASGSLTRFASVSTAQIMVVPSALDEGVTVPQGFVDSSIEIDGNTINGWVWSSEGQESPYFVFYGTSSSGQKDFYRYDATEKTLQRYFQDPNADSGVSTEQYVDVAEKYNNLIKDYKLRFIIICVLIALSVLLLIIVVMLVMGRRGSPYDPDDKMKGKREKKEKKKAVRKSSALDFLEDDEDGEFDDYYDEPYDDYRDEEEMGGRPGVRREKEQSRPMLHKKRYEDVYEDEDSGDDDLEEIEDLEDMERSLAARLAREAREAELEDSLTGAGRVQPAVRRKVQNSDPGYNERRTGQERVSAVRPVRASEAGRHVSERDFRDGRDIDGRPVRGYDAADMSGDEYGGYDGEGYDVSERRQAGYDQEDQQYTGSAQDYEAAAYEDYDSYGRNVRPVSVQGNSGRQSREAARRPVQGQAVVRHPAQSQEAGRRPAQGQDMVRRPVQSQDTARRSMQDQDVARRPVQGQDTARRMQDQEAARRPAQGQAAVRRPIQSQEAGRRPVQSQEAVRSPIQGQQAERRPMQGQEAVRRPAQGQGAERRPVQSQEAVRRPVQGQGTEGRPVQGQEAMRRPMQGQGAERRPAQDHQPGRPVRPQNEASAYRQPQRRPGPQDDDDFEFLDLD